MYQFLNLGEKPGFFSTLTIADERFDKERLITIGMDALGKILVVVFTWRVGTRHCGVPTTIVANLSGDESGKFPGAMRCDDRCWDSAVVFRKR